MRIGGRMTWLVWIYVVVLLALSWLLVGCEAGGHTPSHPIYAHCI